MCYIIQNKEAITPHKADSDILVYKVLDSADNSGCTSYYFTDYMYKTNVDSPLVRLAIKDSGSCLTIDEGYHAFLDGLTIRKYEDNWSCEELNLIKKEIVIGTFIVPKGATYFTDSKEIVSSQLRYTGLYLKF